jgi:hypothetical protein
MHLVVEIFSIPVCITQDYRRLTIHPGQRISHELFRIEE